MTATSVTITNQSQLKKVLRVFAALDVIRWQHTDNYNLINYAYNDLTPKEELLTHWLCYITDQQMPFERVWDIAGYILSQVVRKYTQGLPINDIVGGHFVFSGKPQKRHRHARPVGSIPGRQLNITAPRLAISRRLHFHNRDTNPVEFSSRSIAPNVAAIYRTLVLLERFSARDFSKFIFDTVSNISDRKAALHRLTVALDLLTYDALGQPSVLELENRLANTPSSLVPVDTLQQFLIRVDAATPQFNPHGNKRLWCSVRDYVKSEHFNNCFVSALADHNTAESLKWRRADPQLQSALDVIELPGDTWNNNHIFREGLFDPCLSIPGKRKFPETLRDIYTQMLTNPPPPFYPEQLDVTFDFAPRMCGTRNCRICMFGGGVAKLCHQKRHLNCPVALITCGYVHPCEPSDCLFKTDTVRGICRNQVVEAGSREDASIIIDP
jgi:hypothetical protein